MEPTPFLNNRVAGHFAWKRYFAESLTSKRLAHAYLFVGPEAIGKWTFARALSKRIACGNPKLNDACGVCGKCIRVESNNHPDILWIDPLAEGLRGLNVELARERIIAAFRLTPSESPIRVVIVNDADRMEPGAQNALLKTLEEPPVRSLLILIAKDTTQILDTVLSRCFLLRFSSVADSDFGQWLRERGDAESQISRLVSLASGFPGRALALKEESAKLLQLANDCLSNTPDLQGAVSPFEIARAIVKQAGESQELSAFERRRQAAYGFCSALAVQVRERLARTPDDLDLTELLERIAAAAAELSGNMTPELVTDRLVLDAAGAGAQMRRL
ncbi:MAG: DNA polymerase III subunit delta' [Planctomycetota bacterium]